MGFLFGFTQSTVDDVFPKFVHKQVRKSKPKHSKEKGVFSSVLGKNERRKEAKDKNGVFFR